MGVKQFISAKVHRIFQGQQLREMPHIAANHIDTNVGTIDHVHQFLGSSHQIVNIIHKGLESEDHPETSFPYQVTGRKLPSALMNVSFVYFNIVYVLVAIARFAILHWKKCNIQ